MQLLPGTGLDTVCPVGLGDQAHDFGTAVTLHLDPVRAHREDHFIAQLGAEPAVPEPARGRCLRRAVQIRGPGIMLT